MNTLFLTSALVGTVFFGLKTLFSFFGFATDDIEHMDSQGDSVDHGSDKAFKTFSIHSLTGFLMMFGWVGLASHKQYELAPLTSIFCAFTAGVFMMVVTRYLFKLARSFVSPGTLFDIDELEGKHAIVYHKIPDTGMGKIQVSVAGFNREILAVSENHQEIPSFTEVKILKIINKKTVSVRQIHKGDF